MWSRRTAQFLVFLSLFAPICQGTRFSERVNPKKVEVRFVKSPFADYLFYLLYRQTGHFPELEQAVPLGVGAVSIPESMWPAGVRIQQSNICA
jgi:hypothetical protein